MSPLNVMVQSQLSVNLKTQQGRQNNSIKKKSFKQIKTIIFSANHKKICFTIEWDSNCSTRYRGYMTLDHIFSL